jgi:OmcA/MtrC family decaheme c-type cytochrome
MNIIVESSTMAIVDGSPSVTLTLVDDSGMAVTGITTAITRFYISELMPGEAGSGDSSSWLRWAYEREGTDRSTGEPYPLGTLVESSPGVYTYTFETTINPDGTPNALVGFTPSADNVQRFSMRVRDRSGPLSVFNPVNIFYDFMLDTPEIELDATGRDIVTIEACNSCHDPLAMHGGGYRDTRMCINCHTDSDPNRLANGTDMVAMVHQIHSSIDGTEVYGEDGHDWSEITFPQDTRNCAKCHAGPDGDNWQTVPTMIACGSCHIEVEFATGVNHAGGPMDDNSACSFCHAPNGLSDVAVAHTTINPTVHNPDVPEGIVTIDYVLNSVTANDANEILVDFAIMVDGAPMEIVAGAYPPAGFSSRSPNFLIAYAVPQDGVAMPADYTNGGASISIADVVDTLVPGATAGSYLATLPDAFPAGAMMRTIGLQGYFQQVVDGSNVARHAPSPVMGVEGDSQRRVVADMDGCLSCHESLELHGGNRMNNPQICIMCHNPNLSSSGRVLPNASHDLSQSVIDALGDDPLQYPEATNNFKDMIHGIHAASVRSSDYHFVRARNQGFYYNWSEVTFPGNPANCNKCHEPGTYVTDVPDNLLLSTDVTTDGVNATEEDVEAARASMPNDTDLVITPIAAACTACHDSPLAEAHMGQNGGAVRAERSTVNNGQTVETCELCHGGNRLADVEYMHGLK